MAKVLISDDVFEDYKKTAIKWQPTLLDLPLRAAQDVLKFMRGITGLRGKMRFGEISADSQFAPFKKDRKENANVNIKYREIETFHGNVIDAFSPVDYAFLTMGYNDPVLGEKIKNASTTALVLFHLAKARGQHIAQAVLTGKRNPDGNTTVDLCDGLVTIAEKEITAGTISVDNKNLIKLSDVATKLNTCDLLKEEVVFRLNPFLREQQNILLCAPELVDNYNESYQALHPMLNYNKTYEQPFVEGSHNRLTLVGIPELAGCKYGILTQRDNMIWATDNKSDESFVDIMRTGHYDLSIASDMFLGTQFRTIDPRKLCIVEFAQPADPDTETGKGDDQGQGDQG